MRFKNISDLMYTFVVVKAQAGFRFLLWRTGMVIIMPLL